MEGLFQRSTWPSIPWIWDLKKKCQMHWPFRWMLKEKLSMMQLPRQGQSKDKVTLSLIFSPIDKYFEKSFFFLIV